MKCGKCGFDNPEEKDICIECGNALTGFIRLSENYRLICVLSAEIVGVKSLYNSFDHETVVSILQDYLNHFSDIIHSYSGTMYRCEGNYFVCLFGFPDIREDVAERVVMVGTVIVDSMPEVNQKLTKKYGAIISLSVRAGLHMGRSVVHWRDPESKQNVVVIGNVIDIATKLKDYCAQDEVIVSEQLFARTRYLFEYEALPSVPLEGTIDVERIFKVKKLKSRPGVKHGIAGLHSPMVGREGELRKLQNVVSSLLEAKGGMTFIVGEAGLGKTRLWLELKKSLLGEQLPLTIYDISCQSYGQNIPNWIFLQVLKRFYDIADNDSKKVICEKIIKMTEAILPTGWRQVVPYIANLFSVRFGNELDELVEHLDATGLKLQATRGVREIIFAQAKRQPLLLAIDDFQLVDTASLELLDFITDFYGKKFSESEPDSNLFFPILIIAIVRPDKDKTFADAKVKIRAKLGSGYSEILLSPLDESSNMQLIENLLTTNEIPIELKRKIVAKAQGNPFYCEEIIRSQIDAGVFKFEAGIWRIRPDSEFVDMPLNIQLLVHSRLNQLGKERDILEKAAAIGRIFQGRILECLKGTDPQQMSVQLATLEDLGYIKTISRTPEEEFMFKHPVMHETIYHGLSASQLKELHHQIGECMESIYKDNISNYYELIAQQYYLAEIWQKAYEYAMKSARKAKAFFLNKEALSFYNQALRSIRAVKGESQAEQSKKAIDTIHERVEILSICGDNENALLEVHRGLTITHKIKHKKSEADFLLQMSEIYGATSAYDRMLASAERANELYKEIGDKKGQSESINNMGVVYSNLGNLTRAIEYYNRSLDLMKEINDRKGIAVSLNNIGFVHNQQGNYEQAHDYYVKSLEILQEINNLRGAAIALDNIGAVNSSMGNFKKALDFHERSLEIKENIGDRWGESVSTNNMGYVYHQLGNFEGALKYHLRSMEIKKEIGDSLGEAVSNNNIGHVYQVRGDFIQAFDNYSNAVKIAERIGNRIALANSLTGMGRLLTAQERMLEAHEYLTKAETIAKESGSNEMIRRAAVALAELGLVEYSRTLSDDQKTFLEKVGDVIQSATKIAELSKSKVGIVEARLLQARLSGLEGAKDEANSFFLSAIQEFEQMGMSFLLGEASYYYASFLKENGQEQKAKEFRDKARVLFDETGAKAWARRINEN